MAGTYRIGLAMAGAISAGAYSGGVLDYLFETLEAWEQRKKKLRDDGIPEADWDVPSHDVVIEAMSGASAGGITGALGLIALADVPTPTGPIGTAPAPVHFLGRLYTAWVTMPRFIDKNGGKALLETTDLAGKSPKVASLLDSTLLDAIAERVIIGVNPKPTERAYLAKTVHLFVTHTNLHGVPYQIGYSNAVPDQPGYPMMCHGDRRHFAITGIGAAPCDSPWADPDPARPLDLTSVPQVGPLTGTWADFVQAILGTAAFPAGLAPRTINGVVADDYVRRQWTFGKGQKDPTTGDLHFRLEPAPVVANADRQAAMNYVTSDGGVIDNEPVQLVRWTLMDKPPRRNRDGAKCNDRAVLMIDPFPEPDEYSLGQSPAPWLMDSLLALFPALKNQARFKPEELVDAANESKFSRYLIAPRRRKGQTNKIERYGIACGLLGGFGGFMAESFRAHDYQLGRFNCYHFLKSHFALPDGNKLLSASYGLNSAKFKIGPTTDDPQVYLPVVPVVLDPPPTPMTWPKVTRNDVDELAATATKRLDKIVQCLRESSSMSGVKSFILGRCWSWGGRSAVKEKITFTLMSNLILRDQLSGDFAGLNDSERKVMVALYDTKFDVRTVAGLARTEGLADQTVRDALAAMDKFLWWNSDHTKVTVRERRPNLLQRTRILDRTLGKAIFGVPTDDSE